MSDEKYTEEDLVKYGEQLMREQQQQKENTHSFFSKIITNPSTTRTGNLSEDELGHPSIPARTSKELEVFSKDVMNNSVWADFFKRLAETTTETSLSKDGFLVRMSQTQTQNQKQEISEKPAQKENKGWFKKQGERGEE